MDRRTHARRWGLWERGVALRGCALFLSFSFFPPSRPSSAPVLQPSPPLIYRLQVFGLSFSYCDNSSHLRHCFTLLLLSRLGPFLCCAYSLTPCLPLPVATPHYACRHFGLMLLREKLFCSPKRDPRCPVCHILSLGPYLCLTKGSPLLCGLAECCSNFLHIQVELSVFTIRNKTVLLSVLHQKNCFVQCFSYAVWLTPEGIERLFSHHKPLFYVLETSQ